MQFYNFCCMRTLSLIMSLITSFFNFFYQFFIFSQLNIELSHYFRIELDDLDECMCNQLCWNLNHKIQFGSLEIEECIKSTKSIDYSSSINTKLMCRENLH